MTDALAGLTGSTPAAASAASPTAPAEQPAGIPDDVSNQLLEALQQVPEVQALFARQVPAIFADPASLGEGAEQLGPVLYDVAPRAGFGATIGPKTGAIIMFDPQKLTEDQVEAADADGTLSQLATPVTSIAAGGAAPAAPEGQSAPPPTPTANPVAGLVGGPSGLGQAAAVQSAASSLPPIRQKNPAAGSIVNDLTRRVI